MDADGFLISALLVIPYHAVQRRVWAEYIAAGFSDLRPAHAPVLQLLAPSGSRATELAAQLGVSKQAVGQMVSELEQCGYLERIPDPRDGRAQLVQRTARGWEVNRATRRAVQDLQDEWAQWVGEDRVEELRATLAELARRLAGGDLRVSAVRAGQQGRRLTVQG
jgi:DNA-binding MarR family transcriptional regulator